MTDDDVERRLRSALHAKANRAVSADDALPAMATPAGAPQTGRVPLRVLPALAAAALVASVIGGSVLVAGSNRHSGPGHAPTPTAVAESGTTTAGSLAPTGTLSEPSTPVPPSAVAIATTVPPSGASNSAPVAPPRAPQSSLSTPPTSPTSTPTTPAHWTSPGRTSSPTAGPSTVAPTTQSGQPSSSATSPATSSSATTPTHHPRHSPTHSPPSTPTTSSTYTPTHPHISTPLPTPTTTAAPPPPPTTPRCTAASLTIDVGGDRITGSLGGGYAFLNVTNHGLTCALSGFPTVRIYDGSGVLVAGPAPHRAGTSPQKLVLQHGGGAQFEVFYVGDASPACGGNYPPGRYLQTYLPGQSTAITTQAWGYSPCQLSVTALHAPTSQQPTS